MQIIWPCSTSHSWDASLISQGYDGCIVENWQHGEWHASSNMRYEISVYIDKKWRWVGGHQIFPDDDHQEFCEFIWSLLYFALTHNFFLQYSGNHFICGYKGPLWGPVHLNMLICFWPDNVLYFFLTHCHRLRRYNFLGDI